MRLMLKLNCRALLGLLVCTLVGRAARLPDVVHADDLTSVVGDINRVTIGESSAASGSLPLPDFQTLHLNKRGSEAYRPEGPEVQRQSPHPPEPRSPNEPNEPPNQQQIVSKLAGVRRTFIGRWVGPRKRTSVRETSEFKCMCSIHCTVFPSSRLSIRTV
jgi:hypothetical protein